MDTEDVLVAEKFVDGRHRVDCTLYSHCADTTEGLQIEVAIDEVTSSSLSEGIAICAEGAGVGTLKYRN